MAQGLGRAPGEVDLLHHVAEPEEGEVSSVGRPERRDPRSPPGDGLDREGAQLADVDLRRLAGRVIEKAICWPSGETASVDIVVSQLLGGRATWS